ncbi:MAG TPA: hypothetical protein VFS59_13545 [Gemmatimonadaceae bacterium]|nr:hypothetical protein [Gemmatimonadaceae bacterium]
MAEGQREGDLNLDDADRRGLLSALVGDGRPLLTPTALALLSSGGFAIFLGHLGYADSPRNSFVRSTRGSYRAPAHPPLTPRPDRRIVVEAPVRA